MMNLSRFFLYVFILINFSCTNKEKDKLPENSKKYSILYTNNSHTKIIVFDNNDTIYFSDDISPNFIDYKKIKADKETICKIISVVEEELNPKTLLIKRDHLSHSGYLTISMSCNGKEITSVRAGVERNLAVSRRFYILMNNLKRKYKEIQF